jgi:arylsulfatase A
MRIFRQLIGLALVLMAAAPASAKDPARPNIVIILADDLGYGDIGAYGQSRIKTPHIDRLARQGVRLTDFYAAANICTPSRAGLLTGRYPIRTTLGHEVIQAKDSNGLPLEEVTLAEALKPAGYTNGLVGKWHLGHVAPYWPPRVQGFDAYFGLPYSHDMKPLALFTDIQAGVDYVKDDKVDFSTLTRQFTDKAVAFITENKARPFFLTIAHTAPHLPLIPHADHKGHSAAHAYGDVVEELDASVGKVMAALRAAGIDRNTLVIFTSDNGPWFEGDTGGLHDRKGGGGFDGGYRVPFIARMPGTIPAGKVSQAIAMGIDVFPTVLAMVGVVPPADRVIDGKDIMPLLKGGQVSPHEYLTLFNNEDVAAIRTQRWKLVGRAHYRSYDIPIAAVGYTPLFDMANDPGERFAANQSAPDEAKRMKAIFEAARAEFDPLRTRPAAKSVLVP